MILSIIIPAFNEEETIIQILKKIDKNSSEKIKHEIIVIDDGSTDKTKKLLEENKNLYNKLLINASNMGKGYSVKKGIEVSTGSHIIFQDADLEYNPDDFKKFERVFLDYDADGVIGSRFVYSDFTRSHNIFNKIGNNILTLIFNIFYNTTFTDVYSCYFSFKRELVDISKIKTEGFEQHAEILCQVIKSGKKFYEVPISYNGRNVSEGKKIRYYHFFLVLFQIIKGRIFN